MSRVSYLLICFLILNVGCSSISTDNDKIKVLMRDNFAPLSWKDNGTAHGFLVELAQKFFKDQKIKVEIVFRDDWINAQNDFKKGLYDIVFGIRKLDNNSEQYYFSEGILYEPSVTYFLKSKKFQIYGPMDLKNKTGAYLADDQYSSKLLGEIGNENISRLGKVSDLFKLLEENQHDYVVINYLRGQLFLKSRNIESKFSLDYFIYDSDDFIYMATKKSPSLKRMQKTFNDYLNEITYSGILNKDLYFVFENAQRRSSIFR